MVEVRVASLGFFVHLDTESIKFTDVCGQGGELIVRAVRKPTDEGVAMRMVLLWTVFAGTVAIEEMVASSVNVNSEVIAVVHFFAGAHEARIMTELDAGGSAIGCECVLGLADPDTVATIVYFPRFVSILQQFEDAAVIQSFFVR